MISLGHRRRAEWDGTADSPASRRHLTMNRPGSLEPVEVGRRNSLLYRHLVALPEEILDPLPHALLELDRPVGLEYALRLLPRSEDDRLLTCIWGGCLHGDPGQDVLRPEELESVRVLHEVASGADPRDCVEAHGGLGYIDASPGAHDVPPDLAV